MWQNNPDRSVDYKISSKVFRYNSLIYVHTFLIRVKIKFCNKLCNKTDCKLTPL